MSMALLGRNVTTIALFALLVAVAGSALWLDWPVTALTKQEVLEAAKKPDGSYLLASDRIIGVKLIHRYDFLRIGVLGEAANENPWDRIWVVDVKGMLIAPSGPYGSLPTYTIEVIPDRKPAVIEVYYEGRPGDRPSQWDELWSLSD
jgi:hypothetical protein